MAERTDPIDMHMEAYYKYLQRSILSELFNADAALDIANDVNGVLSTDAPPMNSTPRLPVDERMLEHFKTIEQVMWMAFHDIQIKLETEIPRERYHVFIKNELLTCFRHLQHAILNELYNMDAILLEYVSENNDTTAEVPTTPPHHQSTSLSSPPPLRKKKKTADGESRRARDSLANVIPSLNNTCFIFYII